MSECVYGPVPSRRLGRSLGVSPILAKTCTYMCCYCQLGMTSELTLDRHSQFPPEGILEEMGRVLEVSDVDHVTFVGDGEPTLSSDLGMLISEVKARWDLPVAVITNGSLLWDPEVCADLMKADKVLPTLSAGSEHAWRRLHRPHPALDFEQVRDGVRTFARDFTGEIWLEVMLVRGVNDGEDDLERLRHVIDGIEHDRIDITGPTRPPTEPWVRPPETSGILRAQRALGTDRALTREADGTFDVSSYGSDRDAIMDIGSRHPLSREVAQDIAARMDGEADLVEMSFRGELVEVRYQGREYLLPDHLVAKRANDRQKEVGQE